MHCPFQVLSFPILLAAWLPAQQTWIVDATGGPGSHFTDIPPAVAAAVPGDTIEVRPAPTGVFYTPPVVTKGIKILGDPSSPPVLLGTVEVRTLPARDPFLLAHVKIGTIETNTYSGTRTVGRGIVCQDNLGSITLDDIVYGLAPSMTGRLGTDPRGVLIERCNLVTISKTTIWATGYKTSVRDSTLVATDTLFGDSSPSPTPLIAAAETMFVERGTVRLVDSEVRGTNHSQVWWHGSSAIIVCRSTVHVGGMSSILGGTVQGGGRWLGVEASDLVYCNPGGIPSSVLHLDQRATISGYGHVSRLVTHVGPVPALRWSLTRPGLVLTTTQYTAPSSLTLLGFGRLIPAGVPMPFGLLHLDPGGLIVLDIGAATSNGLRTWTANLSPSLPPGTTFHMQAAELTANLDLQLTNPVSVVR